MMSRIPYGCIVGQCMTMPSTLRAKDWQRSLGVVPDISKWWGRMRMNLSWIWGRVILRIQELHIILLTKWFCSFFSADRSIFSDWRVRYKDEDHVGYDIAGEKIMRTAIWLTLQLSIVTNKTICVWFKKLCLGGGFFNPIWGRFSIWLIFFNWVETTN